LPPETIDTFICVHRRDVDYLLELVLRSYEVNFLPKGKLTFITNDTPYLQAFLDRTGVARNAMLTADSDWLTAQEMELPGWYRQQVIKLRSYEFCTTENFNNLGADTVLLQPIDQADLIHEGMPILYYTQHRLPDAHLRYERKRLRHVARILEVEPAVASRYIDFINDVFCFNREVLTKLDAYLEARHGPGPLSQSASRSRHRGRSEQIRRVDAVQRVRPRQAQAVADHARYPGWLPASGPQSAQLEQLSL